MDFRATAMGSALMSEIKGKEDMIPMFNLDGERLLMTHYCGSGNQPRMTATIRQDGFAGAPEAARNHAQGWTRVLGWMQAFVQKGETVDTRK